MRIDEITGKLRITPRMVRQAKAFKAQFFVEMPPIDFLRLTTASDEGLETIRQKAEPLYRYNRWAKMGDNPEYNEFLNHLHGEKQYGSIIPPFLNIKISQKTGVLEGHVTSHEGRHRAAAAEKKGAQTICAICLKPDDSILPDVHIGVEYKLNSEYLPQKVSGQFREILVTTDNWKIILDNLLSKVT